MQAKCAVLMCWIFAPDVIRYPFSMTAITFTVDSNLLIHTLITSNDNLKHKVKKNVTKNAV